MLHFRNISTAIVFSWLLFAGFSHAQTSPQDSSITVPLGGNTWRTDKDTLGGKVTNDGITNWSDPNAAFTAYVRFGKPGKFKMYLNLSVPKGDTSFIYVTVGGAKHILGLSG